MSVLIECREDIPVPRKIPNRSDGNFGERLARFRKASGYSQRELAAELGISNRMVAYYEKETDHPPAALLVPLSKLLDVTTDELLGVKPPRRRQARKDARLQRRVSQMEKLPPQERRALIAVIDTFLEKARLKALQG
jgi:transcriptional regulator with XRE-family HTH domain